jgi:H+/gluconate symporter-like permease
VTVLVILLSLAFLVFVAYRGFSVILMAPVAALLAVLFTHPSYVLPVFSGVFMAKMVEFIRAYFPVFMLGAVFGKVIELSGFSKSIVASVMKGLGPKRSILSIVLVSAILTYGGVSLFVVIFAVYPFAAEMFKLSGIPKRLIPATIVLGGGTFTMDALPGTPQIQNLIPTTFFHTTAWSAPWLGLIGACYILIIGTLYLEWCARSGMAQGEGYGTILVNEPAPYEGEKLPNPWVAVLPLVLVFVFNRAFTTLIPHFYGTSHSFQLAGMKAPVATVVPAVVGIWAVECALVIGILSVIVLAWTTVSKTFVEGSKTAIGGALLASLNTATEYGYGSVIACLPGFLVVAQGLRHIPNTLLNEAVTTTTLAGITGSASGGMGIALATMSDTFIKAATVAHIPMEVLHRVAAMASGGMDSLPHNGAVITFLAVCGLSHKTAYKNIFIVTLIKTSAVLLVIACYYLFHIV